MSKTLAATATMDLIVDEVIGQALHTIGVLHAAHTPDVYQLKLGKKYLYTGLMSMQAEGVIMRLFDDYTQEITEGVDAYDAASDTMSIEGYGAYITSTDGIDTPMSMMFRHEYNAVADKTEDGSPAFLYVKDSVNGMSLILNPAPDGNWASFTYVRQRKIRDVSTGSNHLDIADKYQDAVMLNVAWKFCGHYKMFSQMPLFKSLYNDEVKRVITDDTPRGPTRMRMAPIIERD